MASPLLSLLFMYFPKRLASLRKERGYTQQVMADQIGIHVSQYKRYESGSSQPTLEVFRKITLALHVSADMLLFEEGERAPNEDLSLQFEAVSKMPEEEKKIVKALLEGMIVKYQTKQLVGGLSS